jgi:hypothetical protein
MPELFIIAVSALVIAFGFKPRCLCPPGSCRLVYGVIEARGLLFVLWRGVMSLPGGLGRFSVLVCRDFVSMVEACGDGKVGWSDR